MDLGFQNIRAWILNVLATNGGSANGMALVIGYAIACYIVLLVILIFIHQIRLRVLEKKTKQLTREYDMLRYLVAKAQKEIPAIQDHPGIKIMFDVHRPNYLEHFSDIKQEIQSIETKEHISIIDPAMRSKIRKKQRTWKILKTFTNIFGWCISVITVFVYKLFW